MTLLHSFFSLLERQLPKQRLSVNPEKPAFIFTELYNCAKIGKVALTSFCRHHPDLTVHVFGTPQDFHEVEKLPNVVLHDLTTEKKILDNFQHGHLGTASLWAKIILEQDERHIIHFDSDVVFRKPVMGVILDKLRSGYSLVGPVRNYQHNPNNRNNVRYLSDVSQTYCFGFDRGMISKWPYETLTKMCRGTENPFGFPVIDFFDPVMFDILRNGGKAFFLHHDEFGGCDRYGERKNKYGEQNVMIDFGDAVAHFAAVGSGMYYFNHRDEVAGKVALTYVQYALEKYAVFCKLFYNEDIGIPYDAKKYASLLSITDFQEINADLSS